MLERVASIPARPWLLAACGSGNFTGWVSSIPPIACDGTAGG